MLPYFKSCIISACFHSEELENWEEQRNAGIISVKGLKLADINSYFLVYSD